MPENDLTEKDKLKYLARLGALHAAAQHAALMSVQDREGEAYHLAVEMTDGTSACLPVLAHTESWVAFDQGLAGSPLFVSGAEVVRAWADWDCTRIPPGPGRISDRLKALEAPPAPPAEAAAGITVRTWNGHASIAPGETLCVWSPGFQTGRWSEVRLYRASGMLLLRDPGGPGWQKIDAAQLQGKIVRPLPYQRVRAVSELPEALRAAGWPAHGCVALPEFNPALWNDGPMGIQEAIDRSMTSVAAVFPEAWAAYVPSFMRGEHIWEEAGPRPAARQEEVPQPPAAMAPPLYAWPRQGDLGRRWMDAVRELPGRVLIRRGSESGWKAAWAEQLRVSDRPYLSLEPGDDFIACIKGTGWLDGGVSVAVVPEMGDWCHRRCGFPELIARSGEDPVKEVAKFSPTKTALVFPEAWEREMAQLLGGTAGR